MIPLRLTTWLEDPEKLTEAIADRKSAASASLHEGQTYAGQFYSLPVEISEGAATHFLDENGIRQLTGNVVADLLLTAKRQIVKPLSARVLPIGGDWAHSRDCSAFGLILDGALEAADFTYTAGEIVIDAGCFNTGGHVLVEVDPLTKNLNFERLLPNEVFFSYDRTEVVFTRYMSRRSVRARFAGKNAELLEVVRTLPRAKPKHIVGGDYINLFDAEDLVAVEYGFALACGDEPARRVIKLGGTVVVDDSIAQKKMPLLPVASMGWHSGHHGKFDGRSMARSIGGANSWVRELTLKLYDSLAASVPWVTGGDPNWAPSDVPFQRAPVDPGDPTNVPKISFPPGVSGDVRQAIPDIYAAAAKSTGISEQASEGSPPAAIKSGVGLANWKSIVNEALAPQHQAYDALWTQVARIAVSLGATAWNTKAARQKAQSTRILDGIDFTKLDLSEDSYSLSFDVTSNLGDHVPMKVELLELALSRGAIDNARYFQLLDMPDWRATTTRMNGQRDMLEWQISQALDFGLVVPPSEFQDPNLVVTEVGNAWCAAMASANRPDRKHLQALRVLGQVAKEMANPPAPPATAPVTPAPQTQPPPSQPPSSITGINVRN